MERTEITSRGIEREREKKKNSSRIAVVSWLYSPLSNEPKKGESQGGMNGGGRTVLVGRETGYLL